MIKVLEAKKVYLVKELEIISDKIAGLDLQKEALLLKLSVIDELIAEAKAEEVAPVEEAASVEQEDETVVITFGNQKADINNTIIE